MNPTGHFAFAKAVRDVGNSGELHRQREEQRQFRLRGRRFQFERY